MNSIEKIYQLQYRILGKSFSNTNWEDVKLISLHIPKTAGTSFFHSLKKEYGATKVARVDFNRNQVSKINMMPFSKAYVHRNPKVIHGHFRIDQLNELISIKQNVPIITWLRDPVERVISNYYYLSKRLDEELDEKGKGLNILNKMRRSLLEYASAEGSRNRMSKFLSGLKKEDFLFVGNVENYNSDIQKLAELLNWKNLQIVEHNRTGGGNKRNVSDEDRKKIAELNQLDIKLYNELLS